MINNKELESINLSATKTDYYQVWNELLDTAKKLSERWDPTSTNETDPGIVLLKVLTAIADKLNYTIDKRILDIYMPSVAQEEAMKKLCDMLGYNMKYYQSATTNVTISYSNTEKTIAEKAGVELITIPKYTNIKNNDKDINYFTLQNINLDDTVNKTTTVECIEGELCFCADDTDNIVSMAQLDDNQRYYLPEIQVAQNGIFITNIDDGVESQTNWTRVENLNTQPVGSKCFKFGFDSRTQLPYIQFPEDISTIIEDGLIIRYTRTSGINGNISYNTLSVLELPETWGSDSEFVSEDFSIKNASAATNGKDKETINDAYNNYKKTIGTFDTLVTCRDYMNKIYQLTTDDANTTPLVSNIIVSDIRDDINRAINLCTFNEYGIAYVDKSLKETNGTTDKISHFDLILYPFTTIKGNATKDNYEKSFKLSLNNTSEIEQGIAENKTISHNIVYPNEDEIVCIKNYLKLNAKITTTVKVNSIEESAILNNIYSAIYNNFNARKIDFGEEIPYDSILSCIENADTRIKNVALDEPISYIKFCKANGDELDYVTKVDNDAGLKKYNDLALRNVLAGRIPAFSYNENFKPSYTEKEYADYKSVYGIEGEGSNKKYIGKVESEFNIYTHNKEVKLTENEIIQFRAPNFKTTKTYPAYVNYFIHLTTGSGTKAIPATFGTLRHYMNGENEWAGEGSKWVDLANSDDIKTLKNKTFAAETPVTEAKELKAKWGALFTKNAGGSYEEHNIPEAEKYTTETTVYYFEISDTTYGELYTYIQHQPAKYLPAGTTLQGIFRSLGSDQSRIPGYMINESRIKYTYCYTSLVSTSPLDNYYIQVTFETDDEETYKHTKDGFGRNAINEGIKANQDYELTGNEWLAINYTPSTTNEDGTSSKSDPVNIVYTAGTIIRPNFDLIDSLKYKQNGHSPSKTSGYSFDSEYLKEIDSVESGVKPGMITLGTNEQIELRDKVEVTLNATDVNIYWERLDEKEDNGIIKFIWDEKADGATDNNAHTLREGEYFYYTDSSKIDLAWYGSGTRIVKGSNTPELTKEKQDTTELAKTIASEGLLAALPWKQYNLSGDKKITLQEYQYVTLTEGDTLNEIYKTSSALIGMDIKKDWSTTPLGTVKYTLQDEENPTTLSSLSVTGAQWQVRSILNLNMAPTIIQTLHSTGSASGEEVIKEKENKIILTYYKFEGDTPVTPTPTISICPTWQNGGYVGVSLEANYPCQSSTGEVDTHIPDEYDEDGNIITYKNDFAIKVFENNEVSCKNHSDTSSTLPLNNYGTGNWTKVLFKEVKEFTLNINKLDNTHGLIMFYYNTENNITKDNCAYISLSPATETKINICNADNSTTLFENGWWKDWTDVGKYYLKPGLNIVEIPQACSLKITAGGDFAHSTLVFSDLDLVNYDETNTVFVINPSLDYKQHKAEISPIKQLLSDIAKADPDYKFYYNTVIDNSTAIDLNTNINEKLSDAAAWYDYNNINNKFVISEIDATHLKSGIVLSSASRK